METLETKRFKKEIRMVIADLVCSYGCGCCGDREKTDECEKRLAKMLNVPKYKDGSGYNFSKFKTRS